jgi:alkylated DNA repair dioxygenase AlkB
VPAFVEAPTATKWFETLRFSVAWKSERRWMYDREVEVPRLVASYRLSDPALPDVLEQAARRATDFTGEPFNSVGLNLYRDGHDSVAPHNDHLYEIVRGHSIALLSLGGARRMTIRSKSKPRRAFDLDLENGSLLLMSYETQVNYDHGVPKSKAPVQARISVALRVRPSTPVRVTRR